jgi:membrane fusion protein, multidrug efflux system
MKKFLILILLISFVSCAKKKKISFPPASVKVGKVLTEDVPIFVDTIGHVKSITSIDINARVEGELINIFFSPGKEVKKDEILFTIDPRPYEAALLKATATMEENIANLKLAQDKVRRYTPLLKENYVSKYDFEQFQTNVELYSAIIRQNKADVETAKLNLNYCCIYSPMDGRTGIQNIDIGNLIKPNGDPIISIHQIQPIFIDLNVPEKYFPEIQKYQRKEKIQVRASVDDLDTKYSAGHLAVIDNQINQTTGMIKLKAIFKNEDRSLWPNQFIKARLVFRTQKDALMIPTRAVLYTTTGPTVFVVKDQDSVELRKIVVSEEYDEKIMVKQGLKEGEIIVLEGQLNLYAGAKIQIKE